MNDYANFKNEREYHYDPPIGDDVPVRTAYVVEIEGMYDVYDDQGQCVNEGCLLPFIPTKEEVAELILTGEIKGKIETIG